MPTYIEGTEVTYWFQYIVDTYGVPNYREANPAVLTVVTYPFFFGMMFGDMGHGSLYLMAGLALVMSAQKLKDAGMGDVASLRYLIFLMGLNAFYCGFIYNEWFAIGTNFFGSCYDLNNNKTSINPPNCLLPPDCVEGSEFGCCKEEFIYGRERSPTATASDRCTYPFGMDPAWSIADNKLEM